LHLRPSRAFGAAAGGTGRQGSALIGSVSTLWRYPVSSMAGESREALRLRADGAEGDRLWGVVDAASGEIARPLEPQWNNLPMVATRLHDDGLEIAAPGRRWMRAPGEAADSALSGFLGFAATILPLDEARPAHHAGPLAQARYSKAPVHLATTASLDRLKALHPDGEIDPRRFRPNLLVEMPAQDGRFPETEWTGRLLSVGNVVLRVIEPCRRCGFTMLAQPGLAHDPQILRNIVRHNAHNLGIYCAVERPGVVGAGDTVAFEN